MNALLLQPCPFLSGISPRPRSHLPHPGLIRVGRKVLDQQLHGGVAGDGHRPLDHRGEDLEDGTLDGGRDDALELSWGRRREDVTLRLGGVSTISDIRTQPNQKEEAPEQHPPTHPPRP